jgi:hypothetical protein
MFLKGAMREKQAPKKWCLAEKWQGDAPRSVQSPSAKASPDLPCLLCQPVKPETVLITQA